MKKAPLPVFVLDFLTWKKAGFELSTPRVAKRRRPDGLVDVVYHETNGCFSAWIAEASSIWLVVEQLICFKGLQNQQDLDNLLKHFPPQSLALAQQYPFPFSLPYPIRYAPAFATAPELFPGSPAPRAADGPTNDEAPDGAALAA